MDEAVPSFVGRWRKVAMVIAKVAHEISGDLPQGDDGRQVVRGALNLSSVTVV
jgi:hypothetical protein